MTQQQAELLKRVVYEATGSRPPLIIDSDVHPDVMMRQVAHQMVVTVDCMTMQRLGTYLSEGMAVIMWGGYLGEELEPYLLRQAEYDIDYEALYFLCFDLIDRHEGEVPDGVIVDTLVAPYLALVIPGSN